MYIGVSIFLIALGAILTFATNFTVSGLDIDVIGIILMVVGVIGLIVDLAIWGPRRRRGVPTTGTVVNERRTYDDI
jgi:hypothetical protein